MLKDILWVGLGGFCGASLRFALGRGIEKISPLATLPIATLGVNFLGCLFMGLLTEFLESKHYLPAQLGFFLLAGFLGGFTTYSAFAHENILLLRQGEIVTALWHLALHILLGFGGLWLGFQMGRFFFSTP